MNKITAILTRDLRLDIRSSGQLFVLPAFFLLIVMLYPLGLGPDQKMLQTIAPGLLMIAALLSSLLPLERLYTDDFKDGTIDLMMLSSTPLPLYITGKTLAHWITAGLPLVIMSPVLALMLGLEVPVSILLLSFTPATILFVLIGQIAAMLSLNTRRASVLLALLVIPLYIPVLIFGAGALDLVQLGMSAKGPLLFLWAMLAFAAPLTPLITSQLLKMQVS